MNKLKQLTEKRYSLVAKMEAAVEKREYDSYDKIEAELRELDAEIFAIKQKQESKIQSATEDNLIRAEELTETQFIRAFAPEESNVSFEDFTRALLFNEGEYRANTNVDGSVLIPTSIAAQVIHKATNNSVLLRKTPVLSMDAPTAIIGRVKDNVEVDFKEKMALGLQTGLGLEGVKLEAKTLYAWVKIAEEDLQDVVNLQSILHTAFAGAVAETIDKNFLYTNEKASSKPGVYPKGIMDSETINSIQVDTIDYDAILKGSLEIAKNNGAANAVGINPIDEFSLYMSKDTSGQYIQPPMGLPVGPYTTSNGIKPGELLVFDKNAIIVGIRKEMDVKIANDLTDGTVLMRVMFRCDVATTQDKHICKVTKAAAK
ncbi:phage major capsid protein [Clostridium perfringens]